MADQNKDVAMDKFLSFSSLASTIGHSIDTLYLVWTSTNEKIEEIAEQDWFDSKANYGANKFRMKQLGGAIFSYRGKLVELMILGMAKLIEDVTFDLKDVVGLNFKIWDPGITLKRYETAIMIRTLANIIKHHHSRISRGSSLDADRLIDEFGFPDGFDIEDWSINQPKNVEADFVVNLYYLEVFLLDLVNQVLKLNVSNDELPREQIHGHMRSRCLPEALQDSN